MKSVIDHPSLGEIIVSQSARSRRIAVSVRPSGEVKLSLPCGVTLNKALAFLESKIAWVEQARLRTASIIAAKEVITMPFATRSHMLALRPGATLRVSSHLSGDKIVVAYPADKHFSAPQVQKEIRCGIEKAWRVEAKIFLPRRLEELSRQSGLVYRSVTVRNTVSRWGSCNTRNDISLSLHLMRLPDELIDYILLHELCHVAHKDHSSRFYRLLDTLVGGRNDDLRRRMRSYNPRW